jgi:hypothetical protein
MIKKSVLYQKVCGKVKTKVGTAVSVLRSSLPQSYFIAFIFVYHRTKEDLSTQDLTSTTLVEVTQPPMTPLQSRVEHSNKLLPPRVSDSPNPLKLGTTILRRVTQKRVDQSTTLWRNPTVFTQTEALTTLSQQITRFEKKLKLKFQQIS